MFAGRLWSTGIVFGFCLALHAPAAAQNRTHVYLVRGAGNVSVGLDALAAKFNRRGIPATVYAASQGGAIVGEATHEYRSGAVRNIVLIGHSLGGGTVFAIARSLNAEQIPIALTISLDSVSGGPAPANVQNEVNYYRNGTGAVVGAGPGFRGRLQNIDVTSVPQMDHMTIQSMPSMHDRIIDQVQAVGGEYVTPNQTWHAFGSAIQGEIQQR